MKKIACGVYPTMITPFRDGAIDYKAVKQIIRFYADAGCVGIFAVCQSSEMQYLSLRERSELAKFVVEYAKEYTGGTMNVVTGGHVSADLDDQAEEIGCMAQSGADVVVLTTNRLDMYNQGDEVWKENMERLLSRIDPAVSLGLYECPAPYKRLLSAKLIDWCAKSGRFSFFKDTCCDPGIISDRLQCARNSDMMIFNANGQTLYYSLLRGAAGYSGILGNFIPDMLVWLCNNIRSSEAESVAEQISMIAHTENENYPATGKYSLALSGIDTTLECRKTNIASLSDCQKIIVGQINSINRKFVENLAPEYRMSARYENNFLPEAT